MHFCTFCITALFLDSYITLRIKWGNVGHLILNGLVWKLNRPKQSKRPWDLIPKSHILYYKCISHVNKKMYCMFYLSYLSCYPCVFNNFLANKFGRLKSNFWHKKWRSMLVKSPKVNNGQCPEICDLFHPEKLGLLPHVQRRERERETTRAKEERYLQCTMTQLREKM